MVQKKIIATLGIWLLISAILFQTDSANVINLIIVGVISAISGFTLSVKKSFEGWTAAIIGLWLIISAFIPSIENIPCKYCNSFIAGIIYLLIGFAKFKNEEDIMTPYDYHNKIHTDRL